VHTTPPMTEIGNILNEIIKQLENVVKVHHLRESVRTADLLESARCCRETSPTTCGPFECPRPGKRLALVRDCEPVEVS
jgi:hypothetical protein